MKREFLQNLRMGDTPLSKEVIDAIMAENGRDIENAKSAYRDYDALKIALEEANRTVEALRSGENWEEKYKEAEKNYAAEMDKLKFSHLLEAAVNKAGGRNLRAIGALLDLDVLQKSENREQEVAQAVENLKEESPYLFFSSLPPLYARGTGAALGSRETEPASLAGALKERFLTKG